MSFRSDRLNEWFDTEMELLEEQLENGEITQEEFDDYVSELRQEYKYQMEDNPDSDDLH